MALLVYIQTQLIPWFSCSGAVQKACSCRVPFPSGRGVPHENVPKGLSRCHTKRRTGARGRARPSYGMTPTFEIFFQKEFWIFSPLKVGVIPKEGRARVAAPVLLLV